jgi:hypothetical protein
VFDQQAESCSENNEMICDACQAWISPIYHKDNGTACCPGCGHLEPHQFLPLFIVTGPSGAGKTAVVRPLQQLLPDWEVFETDILWDSNGDWNMVKGNWLRIAASLAQRPHGRPTILCGTLLPVDIAASGFGSLIYGFSAVHWLALLCSEEALTARLRARPPWRGTTEEFVLEHQQLSRWLADKAHTAFDPPLTVLDTTESTSAQTAEQIRDWAVTKWQRQSRSSAR